MYCRIIRVRSTGKWSIVFYDYEFQRSDREPEDFDREIDAMNRVAELMATEGYKFLRAK